MLSCDMICDVFMLVVDLITHPPHPEGKILIIGGGIANFTNVAATFKGIIHAFESMKAGLVAYGVSCQQSLSNEVRIYVCCGGPNYQEGLKIMRLGESLHPIDTIVFWTCMVL